MPPKLLPGFAVTFFLALAFGIPQPVATADGIQFKELADRVEVQLNGKTFTEYHFKDKSRPFCYPLNGPGNINLTRNWPMKDAPNEEHDHPHHKALWFAHGDVNKVDFWSEAKNAGRVVHREFGKMTPGEKSGSLVSFNDWVTVDGKKMASDERKLTFHSSESPRIIDFEIKILASEMDLVFGDTKEGMMAIRVAESMRVKHGKKDGEGHIVLSSGETDLETWGKRSAWCDYYGPVENQVLGIAIFDHPKNPKHPTWWHVRDYGLFAANPFGVHDFEKKPAGTGDVKVAKGESINFKYRIILHKGDAKQAAIDAAFKTYAGQPSSQ